MRNWAGYCQLKMNKYKYKSKVTTREQHDRGEYTYLEYLNILTLFGGRIVYLHVGIGERAGKGEYDRM